MLISQRERAANNCFGVFFRASLRQTGNSLNGSEAACLDWLRVNFIRVIETGALNWRFGLCFCYFRRYFILDCERLPPCVTEPQRWNPGPLLLQQCTFSPRKVSEKFREPARLSALGDIPQCTSPPMAESAYLKVGPSRMQLWILAAKGCAP